MSGGRRRLWLALALSFASLLLFLAFERFEPMGGSWLPPAALMSGDDWEVRAGEAGEVDLGPDGARLHAARAGDGPVLRRRFTLPPGTEYLRVQADLTLGGVRRGPLPWQGARIVLVQLDGEDRYQWDLPHLALAAAGSFTERAISHEFWISRSTRAVELRLELRQASGEFLVRELSLAPVAEVGVFGTVRHMLFFCWMMVWLWLVVPLMATAARRLRHVLAMLVTIAILTGTLTPHSVRQSAKQFLVGLERAALAERQAAPAGIVAKPAAPAPVLVTGAWPVAQKAMHFLLFVLLALAVLWARPDDPWLELAGYLALFAVICEILQLFTTDRTPQPLDAAINLGGVALGAGAMAWCRRWRRPG